MTPYDFFFLIPDCGLNKEERRNRFSFLFANGHVETVIANVSFNAIILIYSVCLGLVGSRISYEWYSSKNIYEALKELKYSKFLR